MSLRSLIACFGLLLCTAAVSYGEERWYNFAEDMDIKYYIDRRSMVSRPGDTQIFWVKSVAKQRDYFRKEYNLNDLAYLMTNYEIDCSDASYRVRQTVMLDKNRRELQKSDPAGAQTPFEPIPPESTVELAQEAVCAKVESATAKGAEDEGSAREQKRGTPVQREADEPEEAAPSLQGAVEEVQPEELILPAEDSQAPEGPALR